MRIERERSFRSWAATAARVAAVLILLGMPRHEARAAYEEGSEEVAEALRTLRACLATAAGDERACIGRPAAPCLAEAGGATPNVVDCLGREEGAWNEILKERFAEALTAAKEADRRVQGDEATPGPGEDTPAVASTRKAEQAWEAYVNAECNRLYDLDRDGTYRLTVAATCSRDLTAERAITLGPDSPY